MCMSHDDDKEKYDYFLHCKECKFFCTNVREKTEKFFLNFFLHSCVENKISLQKRNNLFWNNFTHKYGF